MFRYFSFLLFFILFIGCGYKPTAYYAKNEIHGKVYVKLKIDIKNSTNSVLIKDAVNEMVVNQFNASLTNNPNDADMIIDVSLGSVSFTTLQTSHGYATLYRTNVVINLIYLDKQTSIKKSISVSATHDYSVDSDSVITESKKEESIKIASQKALSNIFSQIAIRAIIVEDDKSSKLINL